MTVYSDEDEPMDSADRPCPKCGRMMTVPKVNVLYRARFTCRHCGARSLMQRDTQGTALPTEQGVLGNPKWIAILIFSVLAVFLLLGFGTHFLRFTLHAGYVDEEKKLAVEKIELFHERMNAGHFDEMYDDAHPAFRHALSRQEWLRHMQETREQYGLYRARRVSTLDVIMGAPVQVHVVYDSTFEKGDATERFSFARDGDKFQLLIYGVQPPRKIP
jgi:ribosomal protein S27AE